MGADVLVLCYHALSPTWTAALSTTPARFEHQIGLLRRRGYRGTTFAEALSARDGERVAAITFDDAYRSVLTFARPILDRFEFPATVFAVTDVIARGAAADWAGVDVWLAGEHEQELLPLTWDELRSLRDRGWEIGSHTRSHPHLTQVDDETLDDELGRSKACCEHELSVPCTSIAYPYGDVDERVAVASARAGYSAGAALPERWLGSTEAMRWPRIGVYRLDGAVRFRLKVSPALRRLRSYPPVVGATPRVSAARRVR